MKILMKNAPIEFVSSSRLVRCTIGLLVLSGLVLCPSSSFAQTYNTTSILGTVSDPSGAVVPDASVTLVEKATGEKRTAVTNASGLYSFPNIAVGTYELTAQAKGFRTTTLTGLDMGVAKSYTVNVKLQVGELTEIVEVTASSATELQTQDAQVGNVFDRNALTRLPILSRSAGELLTLQPLVIPTTTVGFGNQGGAVSGARSDQSTFTLDGIDISENSIGGGGNLRTVIPIPVDAVEEFRVGVAAPNSSFARSSGGQVALVSQRGKISFHGSAFWFHQNDELNANTWENNRRGIPRDELKDNRFGGRVGGPIWRDKTFFFFEYEGRRFPQSLNVTRVVPSDTLRQGILRFPDARGNIVSYDLATSNLCGASGTGACDPRRLGISPTVKTLYSVFPKGNDPTASSVRAAADGGLNTIGFRSTARAPLSDNQYWLRLDHNFNAQWRFNGLVTYFRELASSATQLDIRNGNVRATTNLPLRDNAVIGNLAGQITSTLSNNVRFGWVRDRTLTGRISPASSASLLGLPGTGSSAGFVALAPAFPLMDAPIDVNTQDGRTQANNNRNFQWADDLAWIKGNHLIQGGTNIRYLKILHVRDDKVVGSLASLVASVDQGSFVQIPPSARPPTCSVSLTTNCLSAADVTRWNKLYAATLGIVDNVSILTVRDGQFNPLPFGTPLQADTTLKAYEFYAQDTWRLRPTITLTYGLSYGWQTPPVEKLGRQTFIVDHSNEDTILNARDYIEVKRQAALHGAAFSPVLAYLPIGKSGRDGIHDIDRTNVAPRVSLAWNPGFSSGLLGSVLGSRKTVVRGGFGITYDRLNTVQSVIIPMLGVGFAQTINVQTPSCTATGTGGSKCGVAPGNPGSTFRIGVDGTPPLPVVPSQSIPVVPKGILSELLSFQVDPDFRVGRNYVADLTIQRELPKKMLVEFGWTGRYARRLPQAVNFSSSPFFLKDAQSGQTFAQAYDALAAQVRAGAKTVSPQPWFENQLPGVGTAGLAAARTSAIIDGRVSDIFLFMDLVRSARGLPAFNSLQVLDLFMRTWGGLSNYNAGFVDLRRISGTVSFDLNYTFSRSLDEVGAVQNTAGYLPTSFNQGLTYGPSFFDRSHVFSAYYTYDFPIGRGHRLFSSGALDKILGGWSTSGIFRAFSGRPQLIVQSDQVFGGGEVFSFDVGAIPLKGIPDSSVHSGVTGSNGIGVNSDPAKNGTGLNLFADPEAAFNSFRKVLLSQDTRDGHAHPLRTFPRWSFDMSLGKRISFTERAALTYRVDFFNIFNHPGFQNPSLALTNPRAFGVVSAQWVPANRTAGSRWIQMSLRVEF